jgi:hypothetical protein
VDKDPVSVDRLLDELYGEEPSDTLYHYTTLDALHGILVERGLWATDIHYFNDFAELRQTAALISAELRARAAARDGDPAILAQMDRWVSERLMNDCTIFVAALTPNGNLLSQWRGYGPYGRGISLGIPAAHVLSCAADQSYSVGRCVYDLERQREVVRVLVGILHASACAQPPTADGDPDECHYAAFAPLQHAILRIAALFKHPAFREEQEWRAVSPVFDGQPSEAVRYRAGQFTLIPYRFFGLTRLDSRRLELSRVYIGPSPYVRLSIRSLQQLLAQHDLRPVIVDSDVPYRET